MDESGAAIWKTTSIPSNAVERNYKETLRQGNSASIIFINIRNW